MQEDLLVTEDWNWLKFPSTSQLQGWPDLPMGMGTSSQPILLPPLSTSSDSVPSKYYGSAIAFLVCLVATFLNSRKIKLKNLFVFRYAWLSHLLIRSWQNWVYTILKYIWLKWIFPIRDLPFPMLVVYRKEEN
jgi:hypothetical protein